MGGRLQIKTWPGSRATVRFAAGVHALAGVVALKLECDPNAFADDPEGLAIARVRQSHASAWSRSRNRRNR